MKTFLVSDQSGIQQLVELTESTIDGANLVTPSWKRMHERAALTFPTWGLSLNVLLFTVLLLK